VILTLTRHGAELHAAGETLSSLRDEFQRNHCVRLPSLIEPAMLATIVAAIDAGEFATKAHGEAAVELCLVPDRSVGLLHFLVNEPEVFRLVEFVSGISPIRSFFGRVYRHVPGRGHFQDWHGDVEPDRHIGMSVNLGTAPYVGGEFQIRSRTKQQQCVSLHNVGFGDAILFRLGDDLEHRVTALGDGAEKTAFAGWFRSEPDYLAVLRGHTPTA
jgi:hypothetical protein